jgi:HlyD family secretion protein
MRTLVVAVLAMLAAACDRSDTAPTRVSGYVEATELQLAAQVGGRLLERRVTEGDRVAAGDVIAVLDTRDIELQLDRARAERGTAEAQLRLVRAPPRAADVRQAEAQVAAAAAEAGAAQADLEAARADLERFEALLRAKAGSQKQRDDAAARVAVGQERVRAAEERVQAAREAVARIQAPARSEEIDVARGQVAAAEAQIALLEKARADARVVAPSAGVVTQTLVEAGELIAPGMPIVVIADLDNAWANLFVPEPLVPRLSLGQAATVTTDAGGEGLPGKITYISPKAEFTPRNVQTADERSRLVYRIKVAVDNRAGVLKQGMPVDAELALP